MSTKKKVIQINTELFSIINKAKHEIHTTSTSTISTNKKLLGTLAKSVTTLESSPANLETLHTILSKIESIKTMEEFGLMLGTLLEYQIPTFLDGMIMTSESNTKLYRLTIGIGKLMLLDSSNYDTDSANKRHIQHVYKTTLHKLSKEFNIHNVDAFIHFEHHLATLIKQTGHDEEALLKGSVLLQTYPHIPWNSIAGLLEKHTSFKFQQTSFLVLSKHYLHSINSWFPFFKIITLFNKCW
jgi:predicted metalloendopeptidase